ncbi:MAG: ABC transporter substrate-binding protein [Clostridia bacterium]|nr:ABC transporter substrate-binding protein [Clostridia bacterium]
MLKRSLLLISLVLLLFTASCSDRNDGGESVTFIDALGREVSVAPSVERVATLLGSFADTWMLAGGEACATSEDAWEDFGLELDAVNIGGAHSPSLELLLSSDPQLVIASASTASNLELLEPLEALGITVAYFDVDSFDDYLSMLDILTDITGRKDLYRVNGEKVRDEIDAIKSRLPDNKPSVLLLRASSGSIKAKSSEGTVLGEMLSDLGCVNIADSDTGILENLSVESIMRHQPYHIFAVAMGDEKKALEGLEKMIEEDPAWSSLEAVKNGRVHMMDRHLFNLKPNSRWGESYERLVEILLSDTVED